MIKDLNTLSREEAWRRSADHMGYIFGLAPHLGIWFDDTEIKYIKTKMMTHKLYRAVAGVASGKNSAPLEAMCLWVESFDNDPDMPIGVKAFIHYYIGAYQGYMKSDDAYDKKNRYANFVTRSFLMERWMETCR